MADYGSYVERHIINFDWYQEPCGVMVLSALNSLTLFEENKPLHLPKFYTFVWFVWLCPTASLISFKNLEFRCFCSMCEGWQKRSWERSLNTLSILHYCRIVCFGELQKLSVTMSQPRIQLQLKPVVTGIIFTRHSLQQQWFETHVNKNIIINLKKKKMLFSMASINDESLNGYLDVISTVVQKRKQSEPTMLSDCFSLSNAV